MKHRLLGRLRGNSTERQGKEVEHMKEKLQIRQQDMYRKALSVLDAGLAGLGQTMKGTVCHTMGSGFYYIYNEDQFKYFEKVKFWFWIDN